MPAAKTPAKIRNQQITAAKRSIKIIRDEVAKHLDALEAGNVPDSSFLPSVLKYEAARNLGLAMLDLMTAGPAEANGVVEVQAGDLAALVAFAHGFIEPASREEGSPVARLTEAAFPDGMPAEPAPEGN